MQVASSPASSARPVLQVSNLVKSFGGLRALSQISFDVYEGEILALIGPNGAGKTSLFNCVNGVYKPEEGSVKFLDRELLGLAPHKIAQLGISRTFQNLALFNNLTVMDSLMLGCHVLMKTGILSGAVWFGRARAEEAHQRNRCWEIVELLSLEPYADVPVGILPYGIQKQIELGRALAVKPRLILLDEPVSGLNPAETRTLGEILLKVKDDLGLTVLLVEHDMALVANVADRVVAMNFGEVIATGSPEEIASHPSVIEAYLGIRD